MVVQLPVPEMDDRGILLPVPEMGGRSTTSGSSGQSPSPASVRTHLSLPLKPAHPGSKISVKFNRIITFENHLFYEDCLYQNYHINHIDSMIRIVKSSTFSDFFS